MGRKRVKHDIGGVVAAEEVMQHLNLKENDGLYPFTTTWRWQPKAGKGRGKDVSLTIDAMVATTMERLAKGKNEHRHFYSEFRNEYPWVVEVLGRGLKSYCLESRCSHGEASYKRNAIGYFLGYCRKAKVKLKTAEDLDYNLMCAWRSDLRLLNMGSRYKATIFRRVCVVLEKLMETELLSNKFTMPIYASDAPDHLPLYSDSVMYQLIGACVSDIAKVMSHARESALSNVRQANSEGRNTTSSDEKPITDSVGGRSPDDEILPRAVDVVGFGDSVYVVQNSCETISKTYSPGSDSLRKVSLNKSLNPGGWPPEKQIPTLTTAFVFLLFFLIFSGRNKEVVQSWRRIYRFGNFAVSPLDWKDPLDPTKCRVRGWKSRKGPAKIEFDDTFFQISSEIYTVLEFLIWYTEPLQELIEGEAKDSLWLYVGKKGVTDLYYNDCFHFSAKQFLTRHAVWDFVVDGNGEVVKERLRTLDSRRFRKVYAAREFMKAVGSSESHRELSERLKHALSHKEFDTTLASYLSVGVSRTVVDIGIFTLQNEYVEEARKFRGLKVEQGLPEGMPGLYSTCAAPQAPDYEGASQRIGVTCQEYDMCFGCSKSRVFSIHLPRIAARIIQYNSMKSMMSDQQWEYHYGKKYARANNLLAEWSDQKQVDAAWVSARSGEVKLPLIIARGNNASN
ncbi:hypothetical protein [Pseudomonas putida]|uniref:hypothetical protein n=2 Tax=Pseudomonas putida group TaxID=136845 RepID=UPI000CB9C64A|nr:hypothetical protein [Pseudomonas putida]MBH3469501.1 hypothetical protein [Pseudomonas putida]PNG89012.1 hypothetical protein CBL13_02914 [Pseudomonas putida]WBM47787.1 hypothetical protein M2J85_05780 [Pseudomonas putida]